MCQIEIFVSLDTLLFVHADMKLTNASTRVQHDLAFVAAVPNYNGRVSGKAPNLVRELGRLCVL